MEQKTSRLYQSAPLENNGLEQRLEKKLNDVNNLNISIYNIEKKITCFKDKNQKSKKKTKNQKKVTAIIKSFDTSVFIATTSSSITLYVTRIGLIALTISTATSCGLSIGNEVIKETKLQRYNKYKKQYKKISKLLYHLINYIEGVYKKI